MVDMLKTFNLELEGRHHSGIDDVHNIARCLKALLSTGIGIFDDDYSGNYQLPQEERKS